jgi:hypothetical protein
MPFWLISLAMVCSESGKNIGWDACPTPLMSNKARTSEARILSLMLLTITAKVYCDPNSIIINCPIKR